MVDNVLTELDRLYGSNKDPQENRFDALDALYDNAGVSAMPEPQVPAEPIDKTADEMGSQYWRGMSFEDANAEYNRLKDLPNTEIEKFSGNLVYSDTENGRKEFVPRPKPKMFSALVETAIAALPESAEKYPAKVANFVGLEVNEDADGMAFSNPKAGVSGMDLLGMGIRESVSDVAQLGAAVVGRDDLVESIDAASPRIDTDDSFWDAAIADGGPALAAALVGDKGIMAVGRAIKTGVPLLSKATPGFIKTLGRLVGDEALAVSTLGTEEGNFILGQDAAVPVWKGLDLEDSASNDVIEQRVNALVEGMMLSSALTGGGRTVKDAGNLAYDILIRPVYTALGPKAGKEQIVFNNLVDQIVGESVDLSDPDQRYRAVQAISRIIDQNSETVLPHLDNLDAEAPVGLDTLNALLRGELSPEEGVNVRSLIAGAQTKGSPQFTVRAGEAKARLDEEIQAYLDGQGVSTDAEQIASMQTVADEAAEQANQYVGSARQTAESLEQKYNDSLAAIGNGISDDLEFSGRLKRLQEITGTDIKVDKDAKLNEIMEGVRAGYEDLSNQKNLLYAGIQGGDINPDGIFDQLIELNDDQISAAAAQVRRSSPLKNMLDVVNTKTIRDVDPDTGEPFVREATIEDRRQLFTDFVEAQGADFGYFYTTIRPELSALASDLFSGDTTAGAGRIVRDMVKYIDNDMVDFVAQSDQALAQAAKDAKDFYKNTYAPIFVGEGIMADYADLHSRTVGRTDSTDLMAGLDGPEFDEPGYNQGVQRLTNRVFSGGVPAEATQMMKALEVASDPDAMADYMVLDVLDRYATEVSLKGLDAANLTNMSRDLQQYATQLNELFPTKAQQINTFVAQIENAARNKGNLEQVLMDVRTSVKNAQDEVALTELNLFLDDKMELGSNEFLPTSNPQAKFSQLFNSVEAIRRVNRINLQIEALPPGKKEMVRKGMEVAYAREFQLKISDMRQEVGGGTPLREAALTKAQRQFTQLFEIGREVFKDKPEVMQALEAYADLAGFVQRNRNARANVTNSNTAFAQEAATATNRLIFTLIGPLSRAGTRARAAVSTVLDKALPDEVGAQIRDKILADPDYFVELSRRYNRAPRDRESEDLLTRFLIGSTVKVRSATDEEDVPMGIDGTLDTAAGAAGEAVEGVSIGVDYLDEQMNGILE